MRKEDLASKIDQTLLKPDVTFEELEKFINENKDLGFYSLCIPPFFVKKAVELVAGVCKISTVIGFPHGTSSSDVKVYEATQAVRNGAKCVDVVVNLSAVKSANYDYIKNELEMLRYNVDLYGSCELRIIIETCLLTDEEKTTLAKLIKETKCDVVKTSTGFSSYGATAEDVALLKTITNDEIKIKASGGIRDIKTVLAMLAAGADIVGTSAGKQLLVSCENE
ncbi:MAG: deoxyribose-phosphate aldolase [Spirochaetales bacterium]|nr:deoxyribose-phosphate aldolase [Spirochaetales bacterium]